MKQLSLFPKGEIAPRERARMYIKAILAMLREGKR